LRALRRDGCRSGGLRSKVTTTVKTRKRKSLKSQEGETQGRRKNLNDALGEIH